MLRPMALALALIAATLAPAMAATEPVTEEEAHAIGVDAYLYFYPIVTMDVTRKQLTNEEPKPGGIGGPMNRFANVGAFPTADMRVVVRPNFDTLYSSGWLDLTKEPMIVSAPDTDGRYYLCRCSTCGATYLPRRDGGRPERKQAITSSRLRVGPARSLTA